MTRIWWSELATPVGTFGLASGGNGLLVVLLPNQIGERARRVARAVGDDVELAIDPAAHAEPRAQIGAYFAGERRTFDLALDARGTDFQQRVWQAVAEVPHGATASYGEVARRIGLPLAPRAVGAANGDNPLPLVIPCHRIVGSSGHLVGYGGTTPLKRWLLQHEGAIPRDGEDTRDWAERRAASRPNLLIGPRSTRIFCRPTCRYGSRIRHVPALFDSPAEAVAQGYRACRVCQPA
jgi:methylated-DNA-[protein]-cysteine S-methyltransferase